MIGRTIVLFLLFIHFQCGAFAEARDAFVLNFPPNADLGRLFLYWPGFQPGEYLSFAKGRVSIRSSDSAENLALRISPKGLDYPKLDRIEALRKIQGIDFSLCIIDDAKFKQLAPTIQHFQDIDLSRTLITDASIPVLASCKKLHYLCLNTSKISGANLALLKKTPVSELRVGSVLLDKKAFEQISQLTNLRLLDFSFAGFNWLKTVLSLSDKDWDKLLAPLFQKMTTLINLEDLSFTGVPAGPESLKVLSHYPKLKYLNLSVTSADLSSIEAVKSCPLERFLVSRCPYIDDRSAKVIGKMKSLRSLELGYTKVTADGLSFIICPNLAALDLEGLKLGKCDMTFLGNLPVLDNLDAQNTQLTNIAIPAISKHTSLEYLNLGNTRVTDKAVPGLSNLTRLKELDVSGSDITKSGYKTLKSKLPNCKILWD